MPKVSVIIPVYNGEAYLQDCLHSICNQTLQDIEIICVNDGSTDRSPEIIRDMSSRDSRIILLSQENLGAGIARNHGMERAVGEYLSFLDCDDLFEPTMLENLVRAADREQADVVVCRADRFHTDTLLHEPMSWSIHDEWLPEKRVFTAGDVKHNFFEVFVWWPWDKLFRKQHIDSMNIAFQGLRTTNDLFFVCAAVLGASAISYINDVLVHQRIGVTTSLSRTREQSWDNFYYALTALKAFMTDRGIYHQFERDYINYCLNFSLWHLDTIDRTAFVFLYQALQSSWFREFGISDRDGAYFYHSENGKRVHRILEMQPEEYLVDAVHRLQAEREQLLRQNETLRGDADRLNHEYDVLIHSRGYRLMRMLTFLPRKIMAGLKGRS